MNQFHFERARKAEAFSSVSGRWSRGGRNLKVLTVGGHVGGRNLEILTVGGHVGGRNLGHLTKSGHVGGRNLGHLTKSGHAAEGI